MKTSKSIGFYLLFIFIVFCFWLLIGILTVVVDETIGIKFGSIILGGLALLAIKLAWKLSLKIKKLN